MKLNFLTLFLLCTLLPGYSQELVLNGTVFNKDSVYVEYATVVLYRSADSLYITGTVTDPVGKFSLKASPGDYFIEINHINYERFHNPVSGFGSDIDIGNIFLTHRLATLEGVIVTSKTPTVRLKDEKSIYKVSDMAITHSSSMKELLRAIPTLTVDFNDNVLLNGLPVRFLMDGREISSNELAAYSPSQILFIEIITNPTSKYDASGLSGIVQLTSQNNHASGISATLNLSGAHDTQIASAGLNYSHNKLNIGGNFSFWKNYQHGSIETILEETSVFNQVKADITNITGNINLDYNLNRNNSTYLSYQYIDFSYWSKDFSEFRNGHTDMIGITHQLAAGYNFRISGKGEQLKANFYYNTTSPQTNSILDYFDKTIDISNKNRNNSFTGTLDYSLPFTENANFEAGAKAHIRNITVYRSDNFPGEYLHDKFKMTESILAGYVLMNSRMENFNVQFGMRGESNLAEKADGSRKWDLFVNALVSYSLNTENQFSFGYNKRVNRPSAADLNPFLLLIDPTSQFQGNPGLLPEYSHNVFLDYVNDRGENKIKISAYYRRVHNLITKTFLNENGVSTFTPVNIPSSHFYGVDFSATQNLCKQIMVQPTAGISRTNISGNISKPLKNVTSCYLGLRVWFKLPYDLNVQLLTKYTGEAISIGSSSQSSIVQGLATSLPQFLSELSISKSILNNNLLFSFRATDPFQLMKTGNKSYSDESLRKSIYHMETRFLYLGVSYKFNNHKVKKKQYDDGGIRVF